MKPLKGFLADKRACNSEHNRVFLEVKAIDAVFMVRTYI